MSRVDQQAEVALGGDEEVVDDLFGRGDLAEAVVPRKVQQIEHLDDGDDLTRERLLDPAALLVPSRLAPDRHGGSLGAQPARFM